VAVLQIELPDEVLTLLDQWAARVLGLLRREFPIC
jgi:hypothetical protein